MNKAGEKPLSLIENGKAKPAPKSSDLLAEADLSRFDKAKKKKKNNNRQNNRKRNAQGDNRQQVDNRAENKQLHRIVKRKQKTNPEYVDKISKFML